MSKQARHAVAASTVFDGHGCRQDYAVVIENTKILGLVPRQELAASVPLRQLPDGAWLAPGFIDGQVNGGGDVLFNDAPTVETIAGIVRAHRRFGTTSLLPTLITDTQEKMHAALEAAGEAAAIPGFAGIHFEGPFISPERPGVHNPDSIRTPAPADLEMLTAAREGVTLITLAPERVPPGFIAKLAAADVRVSLGHSVAAYEETKAALAEGLTGFTHLFNAMRQLSGRDPGPVAAALETPGVWFGMIADGHHAHPAMLRLALRGEASPMLVTDAMPPVGGHKSSFHLYGEEISARGGRCTKDDGTLAGATLDMAAAVRNCCELLRAPLPQALTFASREPARFLGLDSHLGRLAPGYRADMVALDPDTIAIRDSWVAGEALAA
jgi:N-acetylglucosamine-6-phosphate deacetylase